MDMERPQVSSNPALLQSSREGLFYPPDMQGSSVIHALLPATSPQLHSEPLAPPASALPKELSSPPLFSLLRSPSPLQPSMPRLMTCNTGFTQKNQKCHLHATPA